MDNRPGCIGGLLRLFLLDAIFDFLQNRFGFGRGLSCGGCGCGMILLVVFIALACSLTLGVDWFRVGF